MGCLDFVVNIDNNDLHSFNCNTIEISLINEQVANNTAEIATNDEDIANNTAEHYYSGSSSKIYS